MALKRCSSGHFFNPDRFSSCPYCGGGDAAGATVARAQTTRPAGAPAGSDAPTQPLRQGTDAGAGAPSGSDAPTQPLRKKTDAPSGDPSGAPSGDPDDVPTADVEGGAPASPKGAQASARPGDEAADEHEGVTVRVGGTPQGVDPVVGWLVCVEGPDRGRDFRICAERNFIGRDANMDVALTKDKSVSRDRHAILSYDPRSKTFQLAPGEGKALVYHNGASVLAPVEVNVHDTIELGESTLRFVALCGDDFSWS